MLGTLQRPSALESLFRRLEADRRPLAAHERPGYADQVEWIQERFGVLAQRAGLLALHPCLRLSELAPLRRLAIETSIVIRRGGRELQLFQSASEAVLSAAALQELVEFGAAHIETLEDRLLFLHRCGKYFNDLSDVLAALLRDGSASAAPLGNMARRVILDARESPLAASAILETGLILPHYLARRDSTGKGPIFSHGFQSAMLLAAAVGQMPEWQQGLEPLLVAALLQDVGLLLLVRASNCTIESLLDENPTAYRQHPRLSAALAAGLEGYSVDLPLSIARHHERLDGTGYPQGLRARSLSRFSRLLAIAVRFVELYGDLAECGAVTARAYGHALKFSDAVAALYREAEQGEWDRRLSELFLGSLSLKPRVPVDAASADQLFLPSRALGGRLLRLDKPHAGPQTNAAASAPAASERIADGPKLLVARRRSRRQSVSRSR